MFFSGGSVHPKRFTTIDSTNLQLGQTIQNVEKDVLRKKAPSYRYQLTGINRADQIQRGGVYFCHSGLAYSNVSNVAYFRLVTLEIDPEPQTTLQTTLRLAS